MKLQTGFTIIELLMVISIIGILVTVAFTSFTGIQQDARDARRREDIDSLNTAIQKYRNDLGTYPVAADYTELISILQTGDYISAVPKDPIDGGDHVFQYISDADGTQYQLWATLENTDGPNLQYYRTNQNGGLVVTGTPALPTEGPTPGISRPYEISPISITPEG